MSEELPPLDHRDALRRATRPGPLAMLAVSLPVVLVGAAVAALALHDPAIRPPGADVESSAVQQAAPGLRELGPPVKANSPPLAQAPAQTERSPDPIGDRIDADLDAGLDLGLIAQRERMRILVEDLVAAWQAEIDLTLRQLRAGGADLSSPSTVEAKARAQSIVDRKREFLLGHLAWATEHGAENVPDAAILDYAERMSGMFVRHGGVREGYFEQRWQELADFFRPLE